jgi:8-oxo-dGTP pyrophosphatase MutT (NUDIX family)
MLHSSSGPIQQACAIPYRVSDGRIEICLVTSRRKRRWVFPKGIVEPGETETEAALKEAREEAGLRGRIVSEPLGSYERRKWGVHFVVTCFLMHVDRQQRTWRESSIRERVWLSLAAASERLGPNGQRKMLEAAAQLLAHGSSRAG